ncbi:DUF805 domain-containing protein [Chloroflexota bacterium]
MSWYLQVLKKYAAFCGRARRKEYWYFFLFNAIIGIALGWIGNLLWTNNVLSGLYSLFVFLPSLGVSIRRLHDTGSSGWWLLIGLIPLIGTIILLVYMVSDSQEGTNQYGPSPKLVEQ